MKDSRPLNVPKFISANIMLNIGICRKKIIFWNLRNAGFARKSFKLFYALQYNQSRVSNVTSVVKLHILLWFVMNCFIADQFQFFLQLISRYAIVIIVSDGQDEVIFDILFLHIAWYCK